MSSGTFPAGKVGLTQAATFIPEIWADEIIASYEKKLVLAPLVESMPMTGKKGDRINIPSPVRGSASAKAAGQVVTTIYNTESEVVVSIDQHWEYSRFIEDIVKVQAFDSLRKFYTQDAGYALATVIDTKLGRAMEAFQSGGSTNVWATAVIGSDGSTAFTDGSSNAAALTDTGLRKAMQTLDDQDVPMDGRVLVVAPVVANTIRGIARYTEQAFVGDGSAIRTGEIANLYGVRVFVSTNVPASATAGARMCLLFQREGVVLAQQMKPRVQTQYKQEYLADLMTADVLFGVKTVRATSGIALAVPAA